MTEFKQIIGRGTRVRDDYGKYFFNILDYTGSATRHFADPDFDGLSALVTEEEMDEQGHVTEEEIVDRDESQDADKVIDDGMFVEPETPGLDEGKAQPFPVNSMWTTARWKLSTTLLMNWTPTANSFA